MTECRSDDGRDKRKPDRDHGGAQDLLEDQEQRDERQRYRDDLRLDQVLFCDVLCFGEQYRVAGRLYVERAVSATELCGQRPSSFGEFVVVAGELGADECPQTVLALQCRAELI